MLINMTDYLEQPSLDNYVLFPMLYFMPRVIAEMRGLENFPRNPFVAVSDPSWRALYHSTHFQMQILDAWVLMMWPFLGIRGGFTSYSSSDPIIRVICQRDIWLILLAEVNLTCNTLRSIAISEGGEMAFLSEAQAEHNCRFLADRFWNHPYLRARQIYQIAKEHRAHEDFSRVDSTIHIDFLRKYYHTRTKHPMVSLQMADGEHELIPEENLDIDNVIGNDWIEKFYSWLGNKKDIEICKLLYLGATQKEIAKRLGYANHSGVNKRIVKIREILEAFVQWQIDLESESESSTAPVSTIKYDTIEFSYKRN